jgi:hypothetical protein
MLAVGIALAIARGVALSAHGDTFDKIFSASDVTGFFR